MDRIAVECQDFGRTFSFVLCSRPLQLTPEVTIQYYWMDAAELRKRNSAGDPSNLRSPIDLFREAVRHLWNDAEEDLLHVAAARAYLITRSDKSTQRVLRDAFPSQSATTRQKLGERPLSEEDASRLDRIVESRDRFAVAEELDRTLGYRPLPENDVERHSSTFNEWIDEGIDAVRTGEDETTCWLQALEARIKTLRKTRGDDHRVFLNAFAYECKASFYHCYANAWSAQLLPWLIQHRDLDLVSQRFLQFWHCQQRPVEIPHGITSSGILYPTRSAKVLLGPDGRALCASFPTERIGADHRAAVFRGQILALHPLSGCFMHDPTCRLLAGRFFATDAFDFVFQRGGGELCGEYWALIRGILESAIRYSEGQHSYEARRSSRKRSSAPSVETAGSDGSSSLPTDDLQTRVCTEIIRRRNKLCLKCKVPVEFVSATANPKKGNLAVMTVCGQCRAARKARISRKEFGEELGRLQVRSFEPPSGS